MDNLDNLKVNIVDVFTPRQCFIFRSVEPAVAPRPALIAPYPNDEIIKNYIDDDSIATIEAERRGYNLLSALIGLLPERLHVVDIVPLVNYLESELAELRRLDPLLPSFVTTKDVQYYLPWVNGQHDDSNVANCMLPHLTNYVNLLRLVKNAATTINNYNNRFNETGGEYVPQTELEGLATDIRTIIHEMKVVTTHLLVEENCFKEVLSAVILFSYLEDNVYQWLVKLAITIGKEHNKILTAINVLKDNTLLNEVEIIMHIKEM
ncbi:MAG: hypothetical protein ACRDBQ_18935 [Shewanella sp.]